jgi:hypothetical protein
VGDAKPGVVSASVGTGDGDAKALGIPPDSPVADGDDETGDADRPMPADARESGKEAGR